MVDLYGRPTIPVRNTFDYAANSAMLAEKKQREQDALLAEIAANRHKTAWDDAAPLSAPSAEFIPLPTGAFKTKAPSPAQNYAWEHRGDPNAAPNPYVTSKNAANDESAAPKTNPGDVYRMLMAEHDKGDSPSAVAWKNQHSAPPSVAPLPSRVHQPNNQNKTTPAANTSVAATAPSGVQQEVQSKSALDDLMAQLAAPRQADPEEQRRQLFLNFFSSMAKSNSPTLMGSIGEGAGTIAPTIQAQHTARDAEAEKSLEDRIKVAQYQQDYGLKSRATAADELRAQAAMMGEKSNASYRASVVGALGNSGGVNSKNYAQLSTAYTRMKAADDAAGTVNPLTTQLGRQLMAFGNQNDSAGSAPDPLGLR